MSKLLHAPPCFIHASVRAILTLFVSLCLRRRPLPLLQYQIKQQPKPTSALVCSNSPRVVFIQIILLLQKLNEPCSTQFEVWAKGFLLDYLKRLSKFILAVNIGFFSLVGAGFAENLSWSGTMNSPERTDYRSPIDFTGSNDSTNGCLFEIVFSPAGPAFIRSVFSGNNTGLGRYWSPPSGYTWAPRTEDQIRAKLLQCYPKEQINDIVNYAERDWTSQTFAGITFTRSGDSGFLYKFGFEGSGSGTIFTNTKTAIDTTAPTVTFSPANDATDVSSSSNITLTFDEAIRNINNTALSNENVDALITLKNTDASGDNIAFDATINGNVITINPTSDFSSAQEVYVAIGATVEDAADNAITPASATFTAVAIDTTAPTVALSGPTDIVTDAFTVTATFSENVVGFDLGDITVVNGTASALVADDAPEYSFTVTPELGTTVSVSIDAGVVVDDADNANTASNTLSVQAGSPESYFAEQEEEVQAIITQDATRSLTSTLSSNQRMTRGARSRFIESRNQGEGDGAGLATRNNVPFDVDGTFDLAGARLSSKGTFFGQTGNVEGTERRLVFGEFDVQRDGDTGSTTATLTGRVAWEQMISDDTMLGYFVGGELADSNISGAFEGKQTRVAATAGGYAVRALSETLFADGFISIGAGRNNLEMADDVLALTSDYTTRTATVGGALTGVYAYERYELRPEMAFSYGKTWIGDVGFTGVAYGLTDNTLSVDAGTVSTASLTLRPEIVWALDAETVAGSNAQLSFAPRFICERTTTATTTQNCGAGAEIGLSSNSEDGLSSANIRFVMDRVGNSRRSNVVFNVEQRF